MTGPQPSTLIMIPTYNERDLVTRIVSAVRAAVPEASVLVIDDNSPDGTGEVAKALAAADRRVQVLHRPGKQGLGAAYLDAFGRVLAGTLRGPDETGDWRRIVQMDADFSHDPTDISRLLQALDEGADLAVGSRYTRGGGTENWGLSRRLISRGGGMYARMVLGVGIQDLTSGFKAWRIETLRGIDLAAVSARGYGFQIETTYRALRAGFGVVEVPIKFVDRRVGESKMSGTIFFEALTLVWSLRARIPRASGGRVAVL